MSLFLQTFYSPSHNYLKTTRALLIISTVSRQDSTGRENTLNLVARILKVLSINRLAFECLRPQKIAYHWESIKLNKNEGTREQKLTFKARANKSFLASAK